MPIIINRNKNEVSVSRFVAACSAEELLELKEELERPEYVEKMNSIVAFPKE